MKEKTLTIKWTVSRGRETDGWNICTLWDGKTAYRCNGGGYDMIGTVFAEWLQVHYIDEIIAKLKPYDATDPESYYGFFHRNGYYLDGACGLESIIRITKALGLNINQICNRKGNITGFLIYKDKIT